MKKPLSIVCLTLFFSLSSLTWAQAYRSGAKSSDKDFQNSNLPLAPEEPMCSPHTDRAPIKLISWDPKQKAEKIIGAIEECVTTQWDVLKLLSGPNAIGLSYPDEKEQWSYLSLWSYKLKNPIEETVILMDDPGKRVMRGKDAVELLIVFNKQDVVERVEMNLIRKH